MSTQVHTVHQTQVTSPDADETLTTIFEVFRKHGDDAYVGEAVSQSEHALQAALAAEEAGASSEMITAALLHDIGHLLHDLPENCAEHGVDSCHEQLGAQWLADRFGPEVVEPIRLHVAAKRYLCSTDPDYYEALSPASKQSLSLQGGPFSKQEIEAFRQGAHAQNALRLRRWDDIAKIPQMPTPDLEHFRPHILRAMR
jgi:phosphonate degradation associated HDIG domain protein